MFRGPPCKSLTANQTKGVMILEFRDVKRRGEEPVSRKKKRGSDDRVASIQGGPSLINRAGRMFCKDCPGEGTWESD
jgi:hypothetical protein